MGNLNLTQLSQGQDDPETTSNDADDELDLALTDTISVLVDNTNAATIVAADFRRNILFVIDEDTTAPTADITITVPAIIRGVVVFLNNTEQTVYVQVSGQGEPSVEIPPTAPRTLRAVAADGTNARPVAPSSGSDGAPTEKFVLFRAGGTITPTAAGGCAAAATVATGANLPDIRSLNFDPTTAKHAQMRHVFDEAAHAGNVSFTFLWSHAAAATFGVAWNAKGVGLTNDDPIGTAFGTAKTTVDTGGTTNDLYTSPRTGFVKIAAPQAQDFCVFDLFRDPAHASDDLNVDARLSGVLVHYWDNQPLDPEWANVELLFGADGPDTDTTVDDESDAEHVATYNGNAQCDDAQALFSGRSLRVDGTGDWVQFADEADFDMGSGVFCMEGWFMWNSDPAAFQILMGKQNSTGNQRSYSLNYDSTSANVLTLQLSTTGADGIVKLSAAFVPTLTQWYHIAVDWDGTTYRMFVDGVLVASATGAVSLFNSTAPFALGAQGGSGSFPFDGWIDEARFTKASRYTAAFTPPKAPFPRG